MSRFHLPTASVQAVTIIEIRDLRPFSVDPGKPELRDRD
jgi:hypothetical protein